MRPILKRSITYETAEVFELNFMGVKFNLAVNATFKFTIKINKYSLPPTI